VAEVAVRVLAEFPEALVMDVASVKQAIYAALPEVSPRFVGTHPMAGRERGGAVSARSDLFTARPWVMCEGDDLARQKIRAFILSLGAIAIDMSAREHDEAVAVVSHVPQLVASLTAARLEGATPEALSLAGAGLRDVTRIAASDPALWVQIVSANSESLVGHLKSLKGDLESVIAALENTTAKGSKAVLSHTFQQGVTGVSRLPGKHGVSSALATLLVVIDDRPGELARLLTQLGEWGTNLEDLRLEHSPGANVGFAELSLSQSAVADVEAQLVDSGWKIAGEGE
jgi:prephenate dehydrogenase